MLGRTVRWPRIMRGEQQWGQPQHWEAAELLGSWRWEGGKQESKVLPRKQVSKVHQNSPLHPSAIRTHWDRISHEEGSPRAGFSSQ